MIKNYKNILNFRLSYTKSWQKTLWIASVLGSFVAFILIFLQPLDTYQSTIPYKTLKLAGYAFTLIIPITLVHILENIWHQKSKKKWFLYQEVIILLLGVILMIVSSYLYNVFIINQVRPNWSGLYKYAIYISLPYFPIVLPLWYYLRRYWGTIHQEVSTEIQVQKLKIIGNNKNEILELHFRDFIYAQVQQNYLEIFFVDNTSEVQSKMLRLTLAELLKQVPQVLQIHRSFAVNMSFCEELKGNSRKRFMKLKSVKTNLPVSQKYYPNIKS